MEAASRAEAGLLPAAGREASGNPADQTGRRDIVAIGASAGGVLALKRLAAALPSDYRGAVAVVVHTSPQARSELAGILARAGPLPAVAAVDGMALEHGRIHVAPPDRHLLVEPGRLRVVRGPRENRHRPAIDPLFRSAAWAYGPRAVAVVLTGNLDDGTAGLWAVKSCGGTTVVQEPAEADHPDMPTNALLHNRVDHRLPLRDIAALLAQLAKEAPAPAQRGEPVPSLANEVAYAQLAGGLHEGAPMGRLSAFTCPNCRGALWELEEGGHLRYRCHTGHAFSHASLLLDQDVAIEESLYAAVRTMEEKAATLRRLAERWPEHLPGVRDDYEQRADDLVRSADRLRRMLEGKR